MRGPCVMIKKSNENLVNFAVISYKFLRKSLPDRKKNYFSTLMGKIKRR